jgi:hypothetical protein
VNESLVGREEAMAAGEHVPFEPSFERVFAQHFHDTTGDIEFAPIGIVRLELGKPGFFGRLINPLEPIRRGFIGTKNTK